MRWIMVDRLEQCEPGKRAVGIKTFSRSDLLFMDHLPGWEVVPGVLEIEMIAHTAARCVRLVRPEALMALSRVQHARFLKPIRPGDQCRITVEILKLRSNYVLETGFIETDNTRVGEATLLVAILPPVKPVTTDPVLEEWLQKSGETREQNGLERGRAAFARI